MQMVRLGWDAGEGAGEEAGWFKTNNGPTLVGISLWKSMEKVSLEAESLLGGWGYKEGRRFREVLVGWG